MKFSTRLYLCLAIPALVFAIGLGNSIWGLVRTQHQFDDYIRTEQSIRAGLSEMLAQGLQMGQALRNMILDPANPKAKENLTAALAAYDKAYAATAATAKGTPFETQLSALPALRSAQAEGQNKVIAAQSASEAANSIAVGMGLKSVKILVKGPGLGRETAIRAIKNGGLEIISVTDITSVSHNGCRPPKKRRV